MEPYEEKRKSSEVIVAQEIMVGLEVERNEKEKLTICKWPKF